MTNEISDKAIENLSTLVSAFSKTISSCENCKANVKIEKLITMKVHISAYQGDEPGQQNLIKEKILCADCYQSIAVQIMNIF